MIIICNLITVKIVPPIIIIIITPASILMVEELRS